MELSQHKKWPQTWPDDVLLCNDVTCFSPGNVLYKVLKRLCLTIADFVSSTKADANASESTVGIGIAFAGIRFWMMAPENLVAWERETIWNIWCVFHWSCVASAPCQWTAGMSKDRLNIDTELNLVKYTFSIDDGLSQENQDLIRLMPDSHVAKWLYTETVLAHLVQ